MLADQLSDREESGGAFNLLSAQGHRHTGHEFHAVVILVARDLLTVDRRDHLVGIDLRESKSCQSKRGSRHPCSFQTHSSLFPCALNFARSKLQTCGTTAGLS